MSEKIPFTGGDYRKYNDKKYLHHYDLSENEDTIATIKNIDTEILENKQKGTEETKLVLYFEEDLKPLALNKKVNPASISKALGTPITEEWIGGTIALYVGDESRAEDGKAVRIRDYAPKVEAAVCADCGKPITARDKYSVNKVVTLTKSKYGAALCWDCGMKRKEADQ